jgi:hypothetical protein
MVSVNQTVKEQSSGTGEHLAHVVFRAERIGLTHILRPDINLAVWQRKVPRAVSIWLSQSSGGQLLTRSRDIDTNLCADDVPAAISSVLSAPDAVASAGAAALADDAGALADLLAQVSGGRLVRLRLEWVTDQQCPHFHADRIPMRLLCTYRGAGTEWLANDIADTLTSPESMPPLSAINRLGTGDVAIMKGSLGASSVIPLRHRSPPMNIPGEWRLLLAIDSVASQTTVAQINSRETDILKERNQRQ